MELKSFLVCFIGKVIAKLGTRIALSIALFERYMYLYKHLVQDNFKIIFIPMEPVFENILCCKYGLETWWAC